MEKVYLRHIDDTEIVAVKSMEASTITFKDMLMMPIQFLMQFFGVSVTPGISLVQTRVENVSRANVDKIQNEINDPVPEKQEDLVHKETTPRNKVHQDDPHDDVHQEKKEQEQEKTHSMTFA